MEPKPKLTPQEIIEWIDIELSDMENRPLTDANLEQTKREIEEVKQWLGKLGIRETITIDSQLL